MQAEIHPNYHEVTFTCSCGHTFVARSAVNKTEVHLDICSECHPFFTGNQKIMDTAGRVERFRRRYATKKPDEADKK